MIRMVLLIFLLSLITMSVYAEETIIYGKEPSPEILGAPPYPGFVFIRTVTALDAYYDTALYVTNDPVTDVLKFFSEKLSKTRVVKYKEENVWVRAYLLKRWIKIPDNPDRNELLILDSSPNVQVKKYQKHLYEPLIDYYRNKPDFQKQFEALENARTIIRYTYKNIDEDMAFKRILGTWKEVSRDLPVFYGSELQFNPDSTYVFTLTPENIDALANELLSEKKFKNMNKDVFKNYLEKCNPEKGRFSIMQNTISLETDNPVIGGKVKGGTANVKRFRRFVLSLQLEKIPRLSFIRKTKLEKKPSYPRNN